jgi:hypothetical protein
MFPKIPAKKPSKKFQFKVLLKELPKKEELAQGKQEPARRGRVEECFGQQKTRKVRKDPERSKRGPRGPLAVSFTNTSAVIFLQINSPQQH